MNRLPGITGFPIQMVSARLYNCGRNDRHVFDQTCDRGVPEAGRSMPVYSSHLHMQMQMQIPVLGVSTKQCNSLLPYTPSVLLCVLCEWKLRCLWSFSEFHFCSSCFYFLLKQVGFKIENISCLTASNLRKRSGGLLFLHLYVMVSSSLRKMLILSSLFLAMLTPVITSEPQSPLEVVEGQSVTLNWTYNLNGDHFLTSFGEAGGSPLVRKITSNPGVIIRDEYSGRVRANLTDSFSSITFLAVNGSTDTKTYVFTLFNSGGNFATSTVDIQVLGE